MIASNTTGLAEAVGDAGLTVDPHSAEDATILKAAKSCPYRAIAVFDETSAEQLWPLVRT